MINAEAGQAVDGWKVQAVEAGYRTLEKGIGGGERTQEQQTEE